MHVVIRYTVRGDRLEEHLRLVGEAYDELADAQPPGLTYATYQLEDGVSFLELLIGENGPAPLAASPAFQRFRSSLDARCESAPVLAELREVRSLGLRQLSAGTIVAQGQETW
jgi:hypothetical protein